MIKIAYMVTSAPTTKTDITATTSTVNINNRDGAIQFFPCTIYAVSEFELEAGPLDALHHPSIYI